MLIQCSVSSPTDWLFSSDHSDKLPVSLESFCANFMLWQCPVYCPVDGFGNVSPELDICDSHRNQRTALFKQVLHLLHGSIVVAAVKLNGFGRFQFCQLWMNDAQRVLQWRGSFESNVVCLVAVAFPDGASVQWQHATKRRQRETEATWRGRFIITFFRH